MQCQHAMLRPQASTVLFVLRRYSVLRIATAALPHVRAPVTCHAAALLPKNIPDRVLSLQSACQWPHAAQYAAHGWYLLDALQIG